MMHLYLYINDRETRSANQETQETLGTVHRTEQKQTNQNHSTENLTDEQQRPIPNKAGVRSSPASKFMYFDKRDISVVICGPYILTKKVNQFLFIWVEDILVLYSPYKLRNFFPEKNICIALHHGSHLILTNKTTILLHKHFRIMYAILLANHLTILHLYWCLSVFSPLSTVSKLPTFDQSQLFFTGIYRCSSSIYNVFINKIVFYYEIHSKYFQYTDAYR
jgi:hypothetical protein